MGRKKNSDNPDKSNHSRGLSKLKSSGNTRKKFIELLHIFLIFLACFFVWIHIASLDGSGDSFHENLGQLVSFFTLGRYGTLAIPAAIFLFLIGWWSKKRFKPLRWALLVLILGFYISSIDAFIGIAGNPEVKSAVTQSDFFYSYQIIPMETSESGVDFSEITNRSGAWTFYIMAFSISYFRIFGTVLFGIAIALSVLVLLTNLRLTSFFSVLLYQAPAFIFKTIFKTTNSIKTSAANRKKHKPETEEKEHYESDFNAGAEQEVNEEPQTIEKPPQELPSNEYQVKEPSQIKKEIKQRIKVEGSETVVDAEGKRKMPPIGLLDPLPDDRPRISKEELENNSEKLESKLKSLKIDARVINTMPGPVITRYDLEPSAEVKIAKIANSADDIAMALRARGGGVRILAPIPGESAVGVEIPNMEPATVFMREIIESEEFRNPSGPLTIALGKDSSGRIFCTDLEKAPHLLIAGATGSGKSVCINCIITSVLFRTDPDNVRLVLIDPKKLELSLYARLVEQHLATPAGLGEIVITSPENAVRALQSVHIEMERRLDILSEAGVRGLGEYNRWIEKTAPESPDEEDTREKLPYLVVIIDELADLMMVVRREFEELVARLAQMSRAVGIHLIVATQRPSVDVVTGLIKANFPSRIAFKVASKFDSRTIIDIQGAETLLGRGDMLFLGPGTSQLKRLHGALVTTDEVERVVEFVRAQPPRSSTFSLPDPEVERIKVTASGGDGATVESSDSLFEEAAKIVVQTEQGSISMLQRRLRVGYARAARLIDELEQSGIVGPFDGSKSREVLVTIEELRELHGIG